MYIAILIVHLIVSLILIGVILLQAGRGGGLADIGGSSSSLGTRASTYLTKATTVCAVLFICTSISLAVLSAHQGRSLMQQARHPATPPAVNTTAAPAESTPTAPAPAPASETPATTS